MKWSKKNDTKWYFSRHIRGQYLKPRGGGGGGEARYTSKYMDGLKRERATH